MLKKINLVALLLFLPWVMVGQTLLEINGRILEEDTQIPLLGANVTLLNTATGAIVKGTISDEFGNFKLQISKSGVYQLKIGYIGFDEKLMTITVENANIILGAILLSSNFTELQEVVVSGSLEEKQRALNQQRTADNIMNIVSSDLIGRFPDLNVAEALQRVPGINIQRDKGEGSTISIRGTPQNFTTIQINGEQMPSVQQDGSRNEALDLIPADQLASMEITKAPTPDMDGDAIGGVVNLKTPVARKYDWALRGEAAIGYNDISGDINGINKIRLDKRFLRTGNVAEGKLGIILGASHYESNNSEDRIDATWLGFTQPVTDNQEQRITLDNYQYRRTINDRKRIGATATLDYRFNLNHQLVFNYMYNRRQDIDERNRLRFDLYRSGRAVFESLDSISNGSVRRDINLFDELKENQSFNFQGYHTLASWTIDWGAYYTTSKRTFTSDRGDFAREDIDIVADNAGGIYTDMPNFREALGEPSMYDPFTFNNFRRYEEDFETTQADNLVGKIDLVKRFNFLGSHPSYFKLGGKYRSQTNSKFRDNRVLRFFDPNNILNQEESFLRSLSGTEPIEFLNSDYRFGPLIGRSEFQGFMEANRRLLTESDDAWDSRRLSLNDTYDASENISAAYAMARVQFNKLMVLAGLRYESNVVGYDAFEVIRVGTNVEGTPLVGGSNYAFLLPNLHLKYAIDELTAFRFSSVFNYARPNFVDIVPFVNFDADAITLTLGNPNLRPARAFNLDLMFEKYFSNVGIFSIGLFYKDIDQFQFSRIDPSLTSDFPGYPSTQGFRFRQEQNGDNATVAGLEINLVRALDFLPGFLKKLNIDGNYTYAYSDAFTQDRDNISLPGQAAHTFNTAISGDFGKFTGRLSGNYNGTFTSSLASQVQDDIFQLERFQLDANASFQVDNNWRIFTEFTNITNAPSIRYQGDRERVSRIAYFGWQARMGISFRL